MFSNPSESIHNTLLPFDQYIQQTRQLIANRRIDLPKDMLEREHIIKANSPFELTPRDNTNSAKKVGALLIHGLLDCPFSLLDIGKHLQQQGVLTRAILLPGHGTVPSDLLDVTYQDWIQTVQYGVASLKKEVDEVYLVGYSTGATLSVHQALHDSHIAGIILLSPAIKIRAPIDFVVSWNYLSQWFSKNKQWLYTEAETDYTKYQSITFNAAAQVSKLTLLIRETLQHHPLKTPILLVMSREDETVSSHGAIDFFSNLHNEKSKMLLYTSIEHAYPDPRIQTRLTRYPALHIKHFSHVSIPFAPYNFHYGQQGDYLYASHLHTKGVTYGAYNYAERKMAGLIHGLKISRNKLRELTYNPDFDFMASEIAKFMR